MADNKTSGLGELTVPPAIDDLIPLVDVSDTSMAGTGTDKKIKAQTLVDQAVALGFGGLAPTGITYANLDRMPATVSVTIAAASGTLRMVGIWLPAGFPVTNISFLSGTTALNTAGAGPHFWFALFDSSRALLRQSTDDTAATWAASTLKTVNLSSTFTTTYTGWHYIGLNVVSGSTGTQPTLAGVGPGSNALYGVAPIASGTSTTGLGATAPNPAAAISATAAAPYGGVA